MNRIKTLLDSEPIESSTGGQKPAPGDRTSSPKRGHQSPQRGHQSPQREKYNRSNTMVK